LGVAWGPYVYSELTRHPVGPQQASEVSPLVAAELAAPVRAPSDLRAPPKAVAVVAAPPKAANPPAQLRALPAPQAESTASSSREAPEDKPARGEQLDDPASARAFRKAFDSEPRDAFWASDEEPRLAGWLQAAGLPEGAIAELACRTTVCRVAFTKFELDNDAETKLRAKISAELGRGTSFELRNAEADERAPLYLLRAGYKLDPVR
jgi:hypothetical protein